MNVNASFCFHAVGQGLFYTGLLNQKLNQKEGTRHRLFSFVYDCGSTSSKYFLHREIDEFKEMLQPFHENAYASKNTYIKNGMSQPIHSEEYDDNSYFDRLNSRYYQKHLDLLIVSHLHDDHVNGLEYLLKDVHVDTVVMPYMEEDLRLLARLESNEEDALQVFYDDPVGWFARRGVRRIFLATSSLEGKQDFYNDPTIEGYWQDSVEDNQSLSDLMVRPNDISSSEMRQDTEVYRLKNGALLFSERFHWKFQLRNLEDSERLPYIRSVRSFLMSNENRFMSLDEILHSRELTKELKDAIREEIRSGYKINRTSLVVIHEPFVYDGLRVSSGCSGWPTLIVGSKENLWHVDELFYFLKKREAGHCRTILTGDIQFERCDEVDILKPERDMDSINYAVIEYPHHGAKSRTDSEEEVARLTRYSMHVISAGLTNRYGHPSQSVVDKLALTVFVNERNCFDYYYILRYN